MADFYMRNEHKSIILLYYTAITTKNMLMHIKFNVHGFNAASAI